MEYSWDVVGRVHTCNTTFRCALYKVWWTLETRSISEYGFAHTPA